MCGVAPPHPLFLNQKKSRNISYEKNSKVHSEWNRSYGKSDSIVAGSYDNVPVMLYVMGFKPGLSGADAKNYEAYIPTEKHTKSFEELQKINPDVIGWIRVNDTNINYPLLQTDDDDTYMNTDAEGKYSLSGAIFLHCGNKPDFSNFNNIIYGHHMEKEKMFGDIGNFTDETYFDEHPYGNLFFDGKDHGIEFYALMQVDAYNETIFNVCPDTSEAKQAYLMEIINNALYKRELNITEDDHLVLLTTCTSDMTNGRNVLVGRLTDQVYPQKEKAKNLGAGIDQLKDMITNVPVIIWIILIIIVLLLLNRQIGKKGRKKHEKN